MYTTQANICITLSILLCFSCYVHAIRFGRLKDIESIFNVQNYGAKGDGETDDTKAFEEAWIATCGKENGVMLVPSGFKFLLRPIIFDGNKCLPNIIVQVDGDLIAASKVSQNSVSTQWILFNDFPNGLTIRGNGVLDGRGQEWWADGNKNGKNRPHAMEIENSNHVTVTGITIQNSPQMHINFHNCQYVTVFDLTISSPGDSPNTDGIHISHTQHMHIYNSTVACGDDCISIQTGSSDVTIKDVHCGPGHGFSIGSLGYGGEEANVTDIGIYSSTATNTSNGVRIKTWEGAKGLVNNVTFESLIMSNVENPIIIDQYYCNGDEFCKPTGKSSGVAISDVTFKDIRGTYSKRSVALVCSEVEPCKDIHVAMIDLIPSGEKSSRKPIKVEEQDVYCTNAYGQVLTKTNPSFKDCLNAVAPKTRVEAFDD